MNRPVHLYPDPKGDLGAAQLLDARGPIAELERATQLLETQRPPTELERATQLLDAAQPALQPTPAPAVQPTGTATSDAPAISAIKEEPKAAQAETVLRLQNGAVDDMLKSMGIKTCGEIREYLNKTTMDEATKVAYIENNITDVKYLRAFIVKSELTPTQMKLATSGANEILSSLEMQVKNFFLKRPAGISDVDIAEEKDCAYLKEYLKKYYAKAPSYWSMITGTVGHYFKVLKNLTVAGWNKLNVTDKLWTYFVATLKCGLKIWKWVVRDPKVAYWALTTLKVAKTKLCTMAGEILESLGIDPLDYSIFKWMERKFPDKKITTENSMEIFMNDVFRPLLQNYIIGFGKNITVGLSQSILSYFKGAPLVAGTTETKEKAPGINGLDIVSTVAPVAAYATGWGLVASVGFQFVGVVLSAVAQTAIDEAKETDERLKFLNYVRLSMGMILDVANPLSCLGAMARSTEQRLTDRNMAISGGYKHVAKLLAVKEKKAGVQYRACGYEEYSQNVQAHYKALEFAKAESTLDTFKEDKKMISAIVCLKNFSEEDKWIHVAMYVYLSERFYVKSAIEVAAEKTKGAVTDAVAGTTGMVQKVKQYWPFAAAPTAAPLALAAPAAGGAKGGAKGEPPAEQPDIDWTNKNLYGEIVSLSPDEYLKAYAHGERLVKVSQSLNVKDAWVLEWDQLFKKWNAQEAVHNSDELFVPNDEVFKFIFMVTLDPADIAPIPWFQKTSLYYSENADNPLFGKQNVNAKYFLKAFAIQYLYLCFKNPAKRDVYRKKQHYKVVDETWIYNCVQFYFDQWGGGVDLNKLEALEVLSMSHGGVCDIANLRELDGAGWNHLGIRDAELKTYQDRLSCKSPHMWKRIPEFQTHDQIRARHLGNAMNIAKTLPKYVALFQRFRLRDKEQYANVRNDALKNGNLQSFLEGLTDTQRLFEKSSETYRILSSLSDKYSIPTNVPITFLINHLSTKIKENLGTNEFGEKGEKYTIPLETIKSDFKEIQGVLDNIRIKDKYLDTYLWIVQREDDPEVVLNKEEFLVPRPGQQAQPPYQAPYQAPTPAPPYPNTQPPGYLEKAKDLFGNAFNFVTEKTNYKLGGTRKRRANTFKNIKRHARNGQAATHRLDQRVGSPRRRHRRFKARGQRPKQSKKRPYPATRRGHERAQLGRD